MNDLGARNGKIKDDDIDCDCGVVDGGNSERILNVSCDVMHYYVYCKT